MARKASARRRLTDRSAGPGCQLTPRSRAGTVAYAAPARSASRRASSMSVHEQGSPTIRATPRRYRGGAMRLRAFNRPATRIGKTPQEPAAASPPPTYRRFFFCAAHRQAYVAAEGGPRCPMFRRSRPIHFPRLAPIAGVRLAAYAAGMRYQGRDDLMLAELAPGSTIAGVFTQSTMPGQPVIWCREMPAARQGARDRRQFRQRQRLHRPRRAAVVREHGCRRRPSSSAATRTRFSSPRPASSASRRRPIASPTRCRIVHRCSPPTPGRRRRGRS